jgi:thiol-disulfide isomerase/thioredoxin
MFRRTAILLPLVLAMPASAQGAHPVISFRSVSGQVMSLSDFRGHPVLVELWANWCAPCIAGLPALEQIARDYAPQGLKVVPISIDRDGVTAAVRGYARAGVRTLPLYTGDALGISSALESNGLPFSVLIDAQGREVARFQGAQWGASTIREALRCQFERTRKQGAKL